MAFAFDAGAYPQPSRITSTSGLFLVIANQRFYAGRKPHCESFALFQPFAIIRPSFVKFCERLRLNLLLQWLFWICALAGLLFGLRVGLMVSWASGLVTIILSVGTLMPVGNYFKVRRQLAKSDR